MTAASRRRRVRRCGASCARTSARSRCRTCTSSASKAPESLMIGRLNHIAIAVPDLAKAAELYRTVMGAKVSAPKAQPAHGVTVVFVELPNTKIELLHPLGEKSPIANFLARSEERRVGKEW